MPGSHFFGLSSSLLYTGPQTDAHRERRAVQLAVFRKCNDSLRSTGGVWGPTINRLANMCIFRHRAQSLLCAQRVACCADLIYGEHIKGRESYIREAEEREANVC